VCILVKQGGELLECRPSALAVLVQLCLCSLEERRSAVQFLQSLSQAVGERHQRLGSRLPSPSLVCEPPAVFQGSSSASKAFPQPCHLLVQMLDLVLRFFELCLRQASASHGGSQLFGVLLGETDSRRPLILAPQASCFRLLCARCSLLCLGLSMAARVLHAPHVGPRGRQLRAQALNFAPVHRRDALCLLRPRRHEAQLCAQGSDLLAQLSTSAGNSNSRVAARRLGHLFREGLGLLGAPPRI